MAIRSFRDLLLAAQTGGPRTIVAAGAGQDSVLVALAQARAQGIANCLVKAIVYFARHPMAGVVVGTRVPLILPSRSDTYESKLGSLALGVVMALESNVDEE